MKDIKIMPVNEVPNRYNNLFIKEGIKPQVCPEGFERIFIGKRLKKPVCVSLESFVEIPEDIDWGPNPEDYGVNAVICCQQMADGRIMLGWIKD